jgi:Tfp pilus assembly protein PilO
VSKQTASLTVSHRLSRWNQIDAAGIGAILAMVGLLYFAALRPMMDHRDAVAVQRQLLDAQDQKAADAAASLKTARQRLSDVQRQIADNPQKLEPLRALNNRLAKITTAAAGQGLDLTDIRPGSASVAQHYTTVPITLTGAGSFRNCVRYLHTLHERFGDIAVVSVKITGTPSDTSKPATFQLDLRWYAAAGQ